MNAKDLDSVIESFEKVKSSKYLVYDSDIKTIFDLSKKLYDMARKAKERFDHKDSYLISPSFAQYLQLQEDKKRFPYTLYDFRYNDIRINVVYYKKKYMVYCCGYTPDSSLFRGFSFHPPFYGEFEKLDTCINYWREVIYDCLRLQIGVLL